ncbi:hypothetical protein [Anditalea andensis]|uniref:Uncharacterized protein n=1 Tax=Anditalea andensis TaxID=1048983 RepID=A0A074KVP6_9BACT|nr:hypothetical protein [Anditalea andensis]KEO72335.1 hypothetical protein EL17_16435 [Anditalea andensis]
MENALVILVISILLLIISIPFLFFFRRSSDIRLENDHLVFRYPFSKKEITLNEELKSWQLQEAYFLRLGKTYALNLEMKNGKWKSVSSRFNGDTFQEIFQYLDTQYGQLRKSDNR